MKKLAVIGPCLGIALLVASCGFFQSSLVRYSITLGQSSGGTVTVTPSKATYAYGESVSLTPVPLSGYAFDAFEGSAKGLGAPYTLTVVGNMSLSASFKPLAWRTVTETSYVGQGQGFAQSAAGTYIYPVASSPRASSLDRSLASGRSSRRSYSRDSLGRIYRWDETDAGSGAFLGYATYTYNGDAQKPSYIFYYNASKEASGYDSFTYDSANRELRSASYDGSGRLKAGATTTTYDEGGKEVAGTKVLVHGGVSRDCEASYEYDEAWRVLVRSYRCPSYLPGTVLEKDVLAYDGNGNVVSLYIYRLAEESAGSGEAGLLGSSGQAWTYESYLPE